MVLKGVKPVRKGGVTWNKSNRSLKVNISTDPLLLVTQSPVTETFKIISRVLFPDTDAGVLFHNPSYSSISLAPLSGLGNNGTLPYPLRPFPSDLFES